MSDTDKLLALDSFQDATESVYGYRPQVWATGNLMNQRDADRFDGWQMALRALAQPAEAVEVFNCLDCPVSVESPWVAPRCPECGGPTELDTAAIPSRRPAEVAKDAEGINWQALAESFGVSFSGKVGGMLAATYRTAKRDAAQGAVEGGLGRFGHHPDPATDFEVEVESLQGRLFNARHSIAKMGERPETVAAVTDAIERAMRFKVGSDPGAVYAKSLLRALEQEAKPIDAAQGAVAIPPEAVEIEGTALLAGCARIGDWAIPTKCGARIVDARMAYGWNQCREAMLESDTHPQAAPAQGDGETAWREGWALAYSGAQYLYGDDGELQDNRWPMIDWRRDSAMEIRQKIYERGMRALAAAPSQEPQND